MKKVCFTILILLIGIMTVQAQTGKAEQIKQIRTAYSEAKKMIADNGKDGNPALDMHIAKHLVNEVDTDFIIEDDTDVDFYFTKKRKYNAKEEMFYEENVCYFIVEKWSANGHTRYSERLFDRNTEKLIFSFTKSESHAGYVVETRYYYDSDGNLIEVKHKAGGEEFKTFNHLEGEAEEEQKMVNLYLGIFHEIMEPQGDYRAAEGKSAISQTKDSRIKTIRASYAKAKELIEKSSSDQSLFIIVHDQEEGECPPVVSEINYNFSEWDDGQAPMYRCYFISEHRHHNNMGYNQYCEYLLNENDQRYGDNGNPTKTINPMFTYTCAHEEGHKFEWRYYFDENGRCIETKSNHDETDGGKADKQKTRRLLHIFNTLMNP